MPTITGSASAGRSTGSQPTLTVSHTSNGDPLWVVVAIFGNANEAQNIGGCTYGGTALSFILGYARGTYCFQVFRLGAPAVGTANIVFTNAGGASAFTGLGALNALGARDASRLGIANGSSTTPSVTVASASTDDLIVDAVAADNVSQTFTPDASQTQIVQTTDATSNVHLSLSSKASSGSPVTMAQTLGSSDTWTHIAFALVSAAGGGGGGSAPTLGGAWG